MVDKDFGATIEVVAPGAAGPLAVRGEPDELDAAQELRPDELVIPQVKLVQGVSRDADSRQAGSFYNTITKEYTSELRVAVLALSRSRSLFVSDKFSDPPVCVSDDGNKPREQVKVADAVSELMTGPTCKVCWASQWGTARQGMGKGQACRFSYNLLCMDPVDEMPFLLRVSGTSISPFAEYATVLRLRKMPFYSVETIIGAGQEIFEAGKAWVLTFGRGAPLPPDFVETMRNQAAAYRGLRIAADEGMEPEGAEPEPEDIPF